MYEYQLGIYEKAMPDEMPLEEKLLCAKDLGYDYMELCIDLHPERAARLDWTKAEREALMDFMSANGMRFVTLSMSVLRRSPMGVSDEYAKSFLEMLEKGLQLANDLGIKIMLFNGYDIYDGPSTEETRARFEKYLPEAAKLAEKYGVVIAMENAEKEFMDSVEKAAYYVNLVGSPNLRIYGDVGNTANAMGGDPDKSVADIKKGTGLIAAMHLKDTLPGDWRLTPYGKGHVDFTRSVGICKELGIRVYTAELFLRPDITDFKAEMVRVRDFLRSYF